MGIGAVDEVRPVISIQNCHGLLRVAAPVVALAVLHQDYGKI
jgi:hypothetical protein